MVQCYEKKYKRARGHKICIVYILGFDNEYNDQSTEVLIYEHVSTYKKNSISFKGLPKK